MNGLKNKYFLKLPSLVVTVLYLLISVSIAYLHNHPHKLGKSHDNCPACRWEQQLQDTNQSTTVSEVFLIPPNSLVAVHTSVVEFSHLPQLFHKSYPTRSPPLAA